MTPEGKNFETDPILKLTQEIAEVVALANQAIHDFEKRTGISSAAIFETQNSIVEIVGEIEGKVAKYSAVPDTIIEIYDVLKSIRELCSSINRETDERRVKSRIALIKSDFIKLNSLV